MPAVPRSGSSASIPPTPASDGHSEFGFNHDTSQSEQPDDEEQRLTQIRKRRRRRDDPDYVPVAKDMPEGRKWFILSVIMLVQISMNFNAAAYASGVKLVSKEFEVSEQTARWGQATFLIFYAIGSLLWAPWSEELGRRWVLQLSLFLVNICQLPVALAPNFGSIIVGRTLGGLFSAGGSVTLGAMADLWEPDHQGPAVIAVIFASVLGASIAPIPCNAIAQAGSWRWCIWIQLILGVVTQAAHLAFVPETRSTILIGREVERRKEAGISVENIEVPERMEFTLKNIFAIWYRPFEMFVREPIVLFLSLLSGFSDALIFTAIEAFPLVYKQWGFSQIEIGAAYVPIILGYLVASALWFIPYFRFRRLLKEKKKVSPEFRLWFLLFTAPFLSIGLFGFAWTSWPRVHWIATMVFTFLIGLANYSIYVGCIQYTVAAYGAVRILRLRRLAMPSRVTASQAPRRYTRRRCTRNSDCSGLRRRSASLRSPSRFQSTSSMYTVIRSDWPRRSRRSWPRRRRTEATRKSSRTRAQKASGPRLASCIRTISHLASLPLHRTRSCQSYTYT